MNAELPYESLSLLMLYWKKKLPGLFFLLQFFFDPTHPPSLYLFFVIPTLHSYLFIPY